MHQGIEREAHLHWLQSLYEKGPLTWRMLGVSEPQASQHDARLNVGWSCRCIPGRGSGKGQADGRAGQEGAAALSQPPRCGRAVPPAQAQKVRAIRATD